MSVHVNKHMSGVVTLLTRKCSIFYLFFILFLLYLFIYFLFCVILGESSGWGGLDVFIDGMYM